MTQGDIISRTEAIDILDKWLNCKGYNEAERHIMKAMRSMLQDLPPCTARYRSYKAGDNRKGAVLSQNR